MGAGGEDYVREALVSELREIVSTRVRVARQLAGLTQSELAEDAGMLRGAVSRIEQGAQLPSVPTLVALSRALEVSCDFLLGES